MLVVSVVAVLTLVNGAYGQAFHHPGLLHRRSDLVRMRAAVERGEEPVAGAFTIFSRSPFSDAGYRMRGPFESWGRRPTIHAGEAASDATAAYQNSLMWAITGKRAHAEKAIQIINAWKARHRRVTGLDGILGAGIQGFKFVNAAEILRYTESGWSLADALDAERWFREAWLPKIEHYAHFANGNWETAALQMKIATAVYCDDRNAFEREIRYAVHGAGNGSILHTVVYNTGQCQESSRKQGYAQLGLAYLSSTAEVAWNQGVDLYGWKDNRILKGFEYTAAYGLGADVPYEQYLDRTGKYGFGGRHQDYRSVSAENRGTFRPIFEQPYNHYAVRRGLATPALSRVIAIRRPEGSSGDHVSFGTLTHARSPSGTAEPRNPPGIPAGLVARSTARGIQLTWVGSVEPESCTDAVNYTVHRRRASEASEVMIAEGLQTPEYEDCSVERGVVYGYRIRAQNSAGGSGYSATLSAGAGLPVGWSGSEVGDTGVDGSSEFDGTVFSLEGEGTDIGGTGDSFHFTWRRLRGDGSITARIIQPLSSQWALPGVMIRESLHPGSAHASVVLLSPEWTAAFVWRTKSGEETRHGGAMTLPEPWVENRNRLMKPYWVRLSRNGNTFLGEASADGHEWRKLASTNISMAEDVLVGLPACSRLSRVTTTVSLDHVSVNGRVVGQDDPAGSSPVR